MWPAMSEQMTYSRPHGSSVRSNAVQLNVGCGPIQPDGWVNIDNSNRAKLASRVPLLDGLLVALRLLPPTEFTRRTFTTDIRKRWPFADNSVDAIYSGEMLEHFTATEGERFLTECFRLLKPGGILRLRVPDNYRFWKQYVTEYEQTFGGARDQWNTAHERWIGMFFRDICVRRPGLKSMGHYHKWMYDEITLTLAMEKAGFTEVARRGLHDSRISDIAVVETRDDLIIEGVKPS
jgi:predicted SAM-dependent methyltransferase